MRIVGLIFGAGGSGILFYILGHRVDLPLSPFMILYSFVLIAAILFLFIRTEMTYLMYTGMWAILGSFRTFYPTPLLYPMGFWFNFMSVFPYWLGLGYLVYKYLDFRKIFAKKKTYEKLYEEPYKKERKVKAESVPYYYKVLGVSKNSSLDEIKEAYRRLAMIYHPDISADPDGDKKFKEIKKAYEVLSNHEKRAQYDRFEKLW